MFVSMFNFMLSVTPLLLLYCSVFACWRLLALCMRTASFSVARRRGRWAAWSSSQLEIFLVALLHPALNLNTDSWSAVLTAICYACRYLGISNQRRQWKRSDAFWVFDTQYRLRSEHPGRHWQTGNVASAIYMGSLYLCCGPPFASATLWRHHNWLLSKQNRGVQDEARMVLDNRPDPDARRMPTLGIKHHHASQWCLCRKLAPCFCKFFSRL